MPKGRKGKGGGSSQVSRQDSNVFRAAIARSPSGVGEMITRVMTKEATLTANGSGTMALIGTWDASTFGEFTNFAPLYDEWRPIGMKVTIQCQQAFAQPATATSRIMVLVFDNDDATTALTSYANALDYRVKKVFPTVWDNAQLVTLGVEALSVADRVAGTSWQTTGNTVPGTGKAFKYYSTGLTNSLNYLEAVYEYVVQFRQPT
jgi:hypothetical protein